MSSEETKRVVAQRVANVIEAIVIYELKISMAHDSMNQGDSDQQQSKRIDVFRAHATGAGNKKAYAGNLPYCNKCKWNYIGPCTVKCGNCKRVGHTTKNCRTFAPTTIKKASVANQKPPLNFKETKGVVGLTRWFKKMEVVFHISNCPQKCQVKYASCTLQDSALTWWNSYKRIIRTDAAYAMTWKALMKLMTEVCCSRNEIQKMETELWNLDVKAGSENRPPMLNKENYVPWSSRLLQYAKCRPNGKLIHNSIINGPYVRQMILEPGDTNREVPVNETFHVHTDDELTEKELKQIEADDQAIQTILLGLPEDIYTAVDSKLSNEWERFTSNDGELIESYYHHFLKLMNDLKRNKHFSEKISRNLNGYNDVQNVKNQVIQNVIQNPRVQNIGNQNGLIGVPGNANQNENANLVAARAEGNATGHNGNQIRCYNYRGVGYFSRNCTVRLRRKDDAYLQTQMLIAQKEEARIQL
nr:reverse transcriptase domain-containing protein [Tanacetum cinerariifolium]